MSGSELATRARSPIEDMLAPRTEKMTKMIPHKSGIKAERLISQAVLAGMKNPAIVSCEPKSIVQSVMQAAELGLDLSGPLGTAYLVPYGKSCTLLIGYRGLVELAHRSGRVKSIEARLIYENDDIEVEFGTNARITHRPAVGSRGRIVGAYAVAHLVNGGTQFEVMDFDEIEQVRKGSRAGNSGPWKDHWDEMARKTVTRRLCKYLPMTPEVRYATQIDEAEPVDDVAPARRSAVDSLNLDIVSTQESSPAGTPAND